jgi:hypothetical protein
MVIGENGIFKNLSATSRLSAANLTATTGNIPSLTSNTADIKNLTVNNEPYKFFKVMSESNYGSASKYPNTFYFTY